VNRENYPLVTMDTGHLLITLTYMSIKLKFFFSFILFNFHTWLLRTGSVPLRRVVLQHIMWTEHHGNNHIFMETCTSLGEQLQYPTVVF
jgi:hypothetical protein